MARTAQTTNKGPHYVWDKQLFLDHEGKQAIRLRLVASGGSDEAIERVPAPVFTFQIYTTLALEGDPSNLVKYFGGGMISDGPVLLAWEIYNVQNNVFACVDHQRREIAHRKLNLETSTSSTSSAPLIPKVVRDPFSDSRRCGFLLLVDSESDRRRNGLPPNRPFDPSGPLWVHFDRRSPQKSSVDNISRLEVDPLVAASIGESLEDITVLPEKLELVAKRIQNTTTMTNHLETMYGQSRLTDDSRDYGLDEDEGQPTDEADTETADALFQQIQDLSLQDFQCSLGEDIVTVASKDQSSDPDLRYIIYVPFLNSASSSISILESVARAFTSSIISYLPKGRTIYFEFYKPQFPSLGNIISFHRAQLSTRPGFTIGALHTIEGQRNRFYPCTRNENLPFYPAIERYETFVVVLDKPNFLEEQGVLFVMTDGGKFKPIMDDQGVIIWDRREEDYDETVVLRSAGMKEVARRLGMVILTENQPEN